MARAVFKFCSAHPRINPTKLFSLYNKDFFMFFGIKLGHLIAQGLFSYVSNTQA
jgi:hypothetical protein